MTKYRQEYEAISKLFEDKHDDFKVKVLETIVTTGIAVDDPVFLLLAQSVPLRLSIEEVPQVIKSVLDRWVSQVETLKLITTDDLANLRSELIDAINNSSVKVDNKELLDRINSLDDNFKSIVDTTIKENLAELHKKLPQSPNQAVSKRLVSVPSLLVSTVIVALTSAGIAWFTGNMQGKSSVAFAPGGPVNLTLEEAELLSWAKSDRGQLARNIMLWNGDYLSSGQCEKDAKALGVTLTMNTKKATDGFCIVWTKPYKQRNFK